VGAALLLNISGAVLGKFIAMALTTKIVLAAGLSALLALNHVCRVFLWVSAGRRFQLSYIYPVLSINYFFSFVIGLAVFNETFEWSRLWGSFIIVSGVACVMFTDHQRESSGIMQ
jgi:drug/metabolite transporter (DMT)-like permease